MKRKVIKVEKTKNSFKKIKNRVICTGLVMCLTAIGVSIPIIKELDKVIRYEENTYGYSDIFIGDSIHARDNMFVLLDAGDYNTKGAFFFDKKIEYCNEEGMSIGIVINEKEASLNAIYNDVELAKNIINNHKEKIDLPIFLNIDHIIENYNLTSITKKELILSFLTKCESNGIYVGIHGTDKNLIRCKKICEDIINYNACVKIENNEGNVTYDGNYNYIQYPNGHIKAKNNLSKYIIDGSLNSPEKFVSDTIYTVSSGEDIVDISIKFNLSPNDILDFNKLTEKEINEGTILRIPSVLGKYAPYQQTTSSTLTNPLVGADISNHQMNQNDGYIYNPNVLAENFDFIIIKATEGTNWTDSYFNQISKDCIDRNIPIGAYALNTITDSQQTDENIRKNAEAQADHFLSTIANKKIDYPVYLDFESDSNNLIIQSPTKFRIILEVWYEKMSNAGYTPGIYMNQSMYSSMINNHYINNEDFDLHEKFEMWIAGSTTGKDFYVSEAEDNFQAYKDTFYTIDQIKEYENTTGVDMAQPTNVGDGRIYGAANSYGKLDINLSYKDYTKVEIPEDIDFELLEIIEPNQLPDAKRIGIASGGIGIPLITLAGGILIHNRKKRKIK